MSDPLQNPAIPPTSPAKGPSGEEPKLDSGENVPPFSLPPSPLEREKTAFTPPPAKPSPMDIARDTAQGKPQWTEEEVQAHFTRLQNQLIDAKSALIDPKVAKRLTDLHYDAFGRLVDKLNPDYRMISKYAGAPAFEPVKKMSGESILDYVINWINGAQGAMKQSLLSLSNIKNPDPTQMLKLQYAMQRASERGELFASILGAGVSGLKTLMSTQLG